MPASPTSDVTKSSRHLSGQDVSKLLLSVRAQYKVPAIAISVMDEDSIYLQQIVGERVANQKNLATLDDYFHIGSCSKSVLAMIAAKLIDSGKLAWSTLFFECFPEWLADANPAYRTITLQDLLLCRAGIKAYTDGKAEPFPDFDGTLTERRRAFNRYVLSLPPAAPKNGEVFHYLYSNASYALVSAMLERTTGLDYEALVTKTLADDLGINVHLGWPNQLNAEQPWGHQITKAGIEIFSPDNNYHLPDLITAAGDLSMTPRGFADYCLRHLRGLRRGDEYLPRDLYQYLHFSHSGFSLGIGNGVLGGHQYSGIDGSAGTFFCRAIFIPDTNLAFSIQCNAGSGTSQMKAIDYITLQLIKRYFGWWWKVWL